MCPDDIDPPIVLNKKTKIQTKKFGIWKEIVPDSYIGSVKYLITSKKGSELQNLNQGYNLVFECNFGEDIIKWFKKNHQKLPIGYYEILKD